MENANKRHGKKSDKETQSPVLKVFKEMIQRENNDPEKANLLKEKQENRKRRQYSGTRSKSERVNRSGDSSSSEKNRRNVQYKVAVHEQRLKDYNDRSQSIPFQGDKKDSWWFWGDTQKKQRSEDTCSCVSCALKKIISSEYTCIACLGVMFLLTVLIAFLVLFKTVPIEAKAKCGHAKVAAKKPREFGSDVLKRKIDQIQRGKDESDDRLLWDDTISRHLSSLTGMHGNDFDDGNYRDLNTLEESVRSDSELSSVLDAEKLNDGLSSERLRNFYKKLIQTDAQIRSLKKSVNEYTQTNYDEAKFKYPDRSKRSLRLRAPKSLLRYDIKKEAKTPILTENNLAEIRQFNLFYPPLSAVNYTNKKNKKCKRFLNGTEVPTGFVIEKKQMIVQYKPHDNRKVPKCSHAPKDSKSHEKQLKHPFYKNTQRLDELLDQFLDKHLPEIMEDPFGVDVLFKQNKDVKTHTTNVKIENEKVTKNGFFVTKKPVAGKVKNKEKNDKHQSTDKLFKFDHNRFGGHRIGALDREYFDMVSSKKSSSSTPSYDVILSVSTIVGNTETRHQGQMKVSKPMNILGRTPSLLERVPHIRKLLQVDEEDEEGLGYEDLKEVLADDTEAHDDTDKSQDRKKRMDDDREKDFKMPNSPYKYNPPGVHNPNWKGPMPLYPDELSSMIKQAAIENMDNFNKIHIPSNAKDSSETDSLETYLNDMEYIENYSDNKFQKLAKMAQAYSDYGVLEGKKESSSNEKAMDGKNAERRVKLSINKGKSFKNALFDRFRKSEYYVFKEPGRVVSEGIRFEIRPTTTAREDCPAEIVKVLKKHFKVTNSQYYLPFHSTTLPLNTEYALFSTIQKQQQQQQQAMDKMETTTKKPDPNEYPDSSIVFTFAKNGRRSLKSVEDDPDKTIENKDRTTNNESQLLVKDINSLDVEGSDDKAKVGKNPESEVVYNNDHHRHHHSHHPSHHHHHDKSNDSKTNSESGNFKENITANYTSNTNAGSAENTQNNNIISAILNLNEPRERNGNSSEMAALSDFFMMMSNWFSVMVGFETSSETNDPKSNIIKLITKSDTLNTTPKTNESIEFPMYDSDMIENIGHRSRVLMSLEENNDKSTDMVDVTEISTILIKAKDKNLTSVSPAMDLNKEDISTSPDTLSTTETVTANASPSKLKDKEFSLTKSERSIDNKTLVKRNVPEDSNLIFWNDIYDDEYGVKMDPIDSTMEDKRFSKGINFMRKSGNWIQNKVKNFANNFRGKDKMNMNIYGTFKRRVLRKANYREDPSLIYKKYSKRDANYEDADTEEKGGFAALTAKMKEVCKEAAKAVQQTKNVQVRQDDKEDSMTTSLMQQLVRLMTDLIDFQVQQKTCVKLPPDLQEFLVWLTSPNDENIDFRNQKTSYHESNSFDFSENPSQPVLDLVTTPSSEKEEIHADSRSECLGTLHAVQDLMQQYDEMTDEDKSKMTGIRDYLENQLQFLHKQLATFDGYKVSNMFEDSNPSYRFRRDLLAKEQNHRKKLNRFRSRRNRRNRFKRKFLKNFGKKHTRTTASIYDGFAMTEVNKLTKDDDGKETNENGDQRENKNVKRNLKDVYYKALDDAKKSTTFKTTLKDEMEGFDHAQIVRIDN